MPGKYTRVKLNLDDVLYIFHFRLGRAYRARDKRLPTMRRLAILFGVDNKTIRDIWNGRSWRNVTSLIAPSIDDDLDNWDCFLAKSRALPSPPLDDFHDWLLERVHATYAEMIQ